MSDITVIIVTYNSAKNALNLLKSLEAQRAKVKQIILVENNSPEKAQTKKIIDAYKHSLKKNNYIKLIENKYNAGFAKSCNQAAKLAKSKHLLFVNPDTQILRGSLDTLYKHAIKNDIDLIGGKTTKITGERHKTVVRKPSFWTGLLEFSNLGKLLKTNKDHEDFYYINNKEVYDAETDIKVDALGGAYLLVKKASFDKLNGFDERFFMYLEDVDLGIRANSLGLRVIYCPHSTILHEGGASSKNKYKIKHQAWFDSRRYYFKKHFGLLANLIIQPLYITEEFLLKRLRNI